MARKRAAGAGKKPKGDFAGLASVLSVRMPPEMREQLEKSSATRQGGKGWSLTQELLFRVQRSFDRERDEKRDPATRALCYLLAETINLISANTVDDSRPSGWRTDAFAFRTIKLAFAKILDALAPKGKLRRKLAAASSSGRFAPYFIGGESPEETAKIAASVILMSLQRDPKDERPPSQFIPAKLKDYEFGMDDASRELLARKG